MKAMKEEEEALGQVQYKADYTQNRKKNYTEY